MQRLKEKVAFITGGSRGIGAGIAKRLAAEGANVVITYVQAADKANEVVKAITAMGQKAMAIAANSAVPRELTAAIEKAAATFGRIDILVNNAGVYICKPFQELTAQDYDDSMNVNVQAVFVAAQAAVRYMQPGGSIITIGSNMADHVAFPTGTLYAMSKSALSGFTKGLARDLGPLGITVKLVQPGPVDTDMNPANAPHSDLLRGLLAIGRYGKPEEIGALVAYLASEESAFMTGTALTIDGGFNI
jgi:3-oxoacyl-[acyl-carrier protein] reductase